MDSRHQEIARCLFRESNDALFVFDPQDNRVVDVNPAALRMTGYDWDYICELTLNDLFTSQDQGGIPRLIQAYQRTGFFHSREGYSLQKEHGEPIPVNVSVSRIHTTPDVLGLVVARDISDRIRDQNALKESEERYRGLVETARVVIWTATADGILRSLNPAFELLTGITKAECLGRPFVDLLHPDNRNSVLDVFYRSLNGEEIPPIEVRIVKDSGKETVLEVLATLIHQQDGHPALSGLAWDVTERFRMAEAIRCAEVSRRAREAAEASDRAKSEFLGNVSHEIRTPMTAILGFTDILLEDEHVRALPPALIDNLRTIKQNGSHLLDLINDILDLTKIERNELRIEPANVTTVRIVENIADSLRPGARDKGLSLDVEFSPEAPTVIRTDPLRLRQILTNLVSNAIKFTGQGNVKIQVGRDGDRIRFSVMDTGVGIEETEIEKLFEVFYTSDNRTARDSGVGLGLAITKRLVELIGGDINVVSRPGEGSEFRLTLPIGLTNEPPIGELGTVRNPEGFLAETPHLGGRVLVAEDNESIRRFLAFRLEKSGTEVVVAHDGQEAVELALDALRSGRPFDWILMDLQMPKLDGFEATRQLRFEGYPSPIIALTAYAISEHRDECLRFGCDDHVSKPVDWPELVAVLSRYRGKLHPLDKDN